MLFALLLAAGLGAQGVLYEVPGHESGSYFGAVLDGSHDLDGDGIRDLVVGAPRGLRFDGSVSAFSGATGRRLWEARGEHPGDEFGHALDVIGDVDGDGLADLAVGAPGFDDQGRMEAGAVYLLSGRTGTVLRRMTGENAQEQLGYAVAAAGDVDGDGIADLAMGVPGFFPFGLIRIVRGADLTDWLRLPGLPPVGVGYGKVVISLGDLDRDGAMDLMYAFPDDTHPILIPSAIISATTGQTVALLYVPATNGRPLGADVDSDGYEDLLFSRPDARLDSVEMHSSVPGALRLVRTHTFGGRWPQHGACLSPIGDADADGFIDYVVGTPDADINGTGSGRLDGYSGQTGQRLFTLLGSRAYEVFGSACADLGDVNGDGVAEFAVSARFADGRVPASGKVTVFSSRDLQLRADRTEVSASRGGAQSLTVVLGTGSAGRPYLILGTVSGSSPGFTWQGVAVPLNPDFYTGFTLTAAGGSVLWNTTGILDGNGGAQAQIRVPAGLGLQGIEVQHSCLFFDTSLVLLGATGTVPLVLLQ